MQVGSIKIFSGSHILKSTSFNEKLETNEKKEKFHISPFLTHLLVTIFLKVRISLREFGGVKAGFAF